mmetsp:Transcript_35679/g.83922  ORF Transcript_35679/g.83922 Transcript_35679/m.83922 type:complete len:662 (+) Transcript_35679:731-2716(+)
MLTPCRPAQIELAVLPDEARPALTARTAALAEGTRPACAETEVGALGCLQVWGRLTLHGCHVGAAAARAAAPRVLSEARVGVCPNEASVMCRRHHLPALAALHDQLELVACPAVANNRVGKLDDPVRGERRAALEAEAVGVTAAGHDRHAVSLLVRVAVGADLVEANKLGGGGRDGAEAGFPDLEEEARRGGGGEASRVDFQRAELGLAEDAAVEAGRELGREGGREHAGAARRAKVQEVREVVGDQRGVGRGQQESEREGSMRGLGMRGVGCSVRRRQREDAPVVLVGVVLLRVLLLERDPRRAPAHPRHVVQDVERHAQHPRHPHVAVVVRFQPRVLKPRVLNDHRPLVRQRHVPGTVQPSSEVCRAPISKAFAFFPVHKVKVVRRGVSQVLDVAGVVVSHERCAVVETVDDRSAVSPVIPHSRKAITLPHVQHPPVRRDALVRVLREVVSEHVGPKPPVGVERVSLHPRQRRRARADFSSRHAASHGPSVHQHAVEVPSHAVANQIGGRREHVDPRHVERRVSLAVGCAGNSTAVKDIVAVRPRADGHVVLQRVGHLVAVLDVHGCAAHVVEDVGVRDGKVGAVHDQPALHAKLDRVVAEETGRARAHVVQVQAVFPFDASLPALLDSHILNSVRPAVHVHCVQPDGTLCAERRTPAP